MRPCRFHVTFSIFIAVRRLCRRANARNPRAVEKDEASEGASHVAKLFAGVTTAVGDGSGRGYATCRSACMGVFRVALRREDGKRPDNASAHKPGIRDVRFMYE